MLSLREQPAKSALAESIPSKATVLFPVVHLQEPRPIGPLHPDNNLQLPDPSSHCAHQVLVQTPSALQKADTCSVNLVMRRPPNRLWTVLPALAGPAVLCGRSETEIDWARLQTFHMRCESRPLSLFSLTIIMVNDCRPLDLRSVTTPNSSLIPRPTAPPPGCPCP